MIIFYVRNEKYTICGFQDTFYESEATSTDNILHEVGTVTVQFKMNKKNNTEARALDKEDATKFRSNFLKSISVEPSIALFCLGYSIIGVQVATLYIKKSCRVGSYFFGNQTFSPEVCY